MGVMSQRRGIVCGRDESRRQEPNGACLCASKCGQGQTDRVRAPVDRLGVRCFLSQSSLVVFICRTRIRLTFLLSPAMSALPNDQDGQHNGCASRLTSFWLDRRGLLHTERQKYPPAVKREVKNSNKGTNTDQSGQAVRERRRNEQDGCRNLHQMTSQNQQLRNGNHCSPCVVKRWISEE